jgi:hypothetical protein
VHGTQNAGRYGTSSTNNILELDPANGYVGGLAIMLVYATRGHWTSLGKGAMRFTQ